MEDATLSSCRHRNCKCFYSLQLFGPSGRVESYQMTLEMPLYFKLYSSTEEVKEEALLLGDHPAVTWQHSVSSSSEGKMPVL